MRKCILFFLLLVFVLIIASVSENRQRIEDNDQVAMEDNAKDLNLKENAAFGEKLPQ